MSTSIYLPKYENSWALVIGINNYHHVSNLEYACSDAQAVAEILTKQLSFEDETVILLKNEEATRDKIMDSFLNFRNLTGRDDRLLIFSAGHGHTMSGHRGEIGYLIPVDGDIEKLASLIRWDDLTRNADLIPAKHIFFVMDACYSGLAITRGTPRGSSRFLASMFRRRSRQVLTAGKADEVVADAGGPIPEHSVFTGHLIQALEGNAADPKGIITASQVMAYVYDKVAKDGHSHQTPHYGFVEGDGDFVFYPCDLTVLDDGREGTESDILVEIPPTSDITEKDYLDLIDSVKTYLSDASYRIKLDDLATQEIRRVLALTSDDAFSAGPKVTETEFANRVTKYETIVRNLTTMVALLTHWGRKENIPIIHKIITRISEVPKPSSGMNVWIHLHWYPAAILMYAGGVAAIAGNNYDNLAALLLTTISVDDYSSEPTEVAYQIPSGLG